MNQTAWFSSSTHWHNVPVWLPEEKHLFQKRYYMTSEYLEIKHTSCTNCFYGAFAFILKLESSSSHIMQAKGNKLQYIIYKILMEWHCIFAFVDKLIL